MALENDLQLQEQVDALATRLVLDGAGSALAADLARLSEQAGGRGCRETSRIAAELAEKTRGGETGADAAVLEELLRGGIAQL